MDVMKDVLDLVREGQKHCKKEDLMEAAVAFYATGYHPALGHLPSVLGKKAQNARVTAAMAFIRGLQDIATSIGAEIVRVQENPAYPEFHLRLAGSYLGRTPIAIINPCEKKLTTFVRLVENTISPLEGRGLEKSNQAIQTAITQGTLFIENNHLLVEHLLTFGYDVEEVK